MANSKLSTRMDKKVVLVVAAHPDDEVLGCGGTIARHVAEGDAVHVVFMADGVTSRSALANSSEQQARNASAYRACEILGANEPVFLGFPDNRMDTLALLDIVQALEKEIQTIQPDIVYTHHYGDLNIDHRITHQAVMAACRPQGNYSVKTILCFEVPSSTEWQTPNSGQVFEPNWFVNISDTLETKMKALQAYHEEMRSPPHSRSIENVVRISALRGANIGIEYAEAFQLLRLIK